MPNYVLTDADDVVVTRSLGSPFSDVPEGFLERETEEWPMPGMRFVAGAFVLVGPPLDVAKARAARAVMAERDRRIDGGFTFEGAGYQSRSGDRENIAGSAQLAMQAIIAGGGEVGDLRWHGGDEDFAWIAEDNSFAPMDAPTVLAFARAAAAMKSACIFNAKALKDEIAAAADAAAVASIDIASGWPV